MTKGRDNAAENLGDVVEMVRLRRQSGLLSVERFLDGRFEEGEINFHNGQPINAYSGQISGQDALIWLLSWHQVYFTFLADEPRPSAIIANNAVAVATNQPTSPLSSRSLPLNSGDIGPTGLPPASNTMLSRRERIRDNAYAQSNRLGNAAAAQTTSTPGLEWLVPQKLGEERDVLSLPLTRPQRSIYMLVDGQRSISDLSRCMRKSSQEIERLLIELREQGLITI